MPDQPQTVDPRSAKIILSAIVAMASIAMLLLFAFTGDGSGGTDGTTTTTAPTTTEPPITNTTSTTSSTTSTTAPADDLGMFLINPAGLRGLEDVETLTYQQITDAGAATDPRWTGPSPVAAPASPQGQFRISCTISHLAYDDPIISPNQPGASHLHQFFGNTQVDAFTDFEFPPDPLNPTSLMNRGASSCQGQAANRSAYWTPAMLNADGDFVMPELITLYYKSHRPAEVDILPPGIQMLAGNIDQETGEVLDTFTPRESLTWGCTDGSLSRIRLNVIPGTAGSAPCPSNQSIQASIQFPQCFAVEPDGSIVLGSDNHVDHTHALENQFGGNQNTRCPSSHPYRAPQITYLIKYETPEPAEVRGWRLSSDPVDESGNVDQPGGTLHGDWFGGWHPDAIQLWIDGCFLDRPSNCSLGVTGLTDRQFHRLNGTNIRADFYSGPQVIDCPLCVRQDR